MQDGRRDSQVNARTQGPQWNLSGKVACAVLSMCACTCGTVLHTVDCVTRSFIHSFISFHFISFHFISFHFISFHFISFHFISFHFISFHFISFHFNFISFHFISFHFISFHFISFHFISFHFISFHFISFHFISFHFISFTYRHIAQRYWKARQTKVRDVSDTCSWVLRALGVRVCACGCGHPLLFRTRGLERSRSCPAERSLPPAPRAFPWRMGPTSTRPAMPTTLLSTTCARAGVCRGSRIICAAR